MGEKLSATKAVEKGRKRRKEEALIPCQKSRQHVHTLHVYIPFCFELYFLSLDDLTT